MDGRGASAAAARACSSTSAKAPQLSSALASELRHIHDPTGSVAARGVLGQARAGLSLSVPSLLAELDGIGETILLYQGERGRPRARHTITKVTPTQQRLYTIFDLARYGPHR
jgi:hypothetical protein